MESITHTWAEGGKFRLSTLLKRTKYCVAIRENLGTNGKYYTRRKEGSFGTEEEAVIALKHRAVKMGLKVFQQRSYYSISSEKFDREKLVEYFPNLTITSDTDINTQYKHTDSKGVKSVLVYDKSIGVWDVLSPLGKSFFCIPPTTFYCFTHDLERCGVDIEQKQEDPVEEI